MESGVLDKGDIQKVQGRGPPGQVWEPLLNIQDFLFFFMHHHVPLGVPYYRATNSVILHNTYHAREIVPMI